MLDLMSLLLQIVIGLVILGVLVLIHETGHFLMAKAWGIRVLAFSIGFGKPIFKKKINDTEYRICSIPFGGYVAMSGEHPEDDTPPQPGDFTSKPVGQRALVALAGPAANYLFAMVFLWIAFLVGVDRPTYLNRPVVGAVADSSAAKQAGLRPGDSIVSINGVKTATWEKVQAALSGRSNELKVDFVRDGVRDTIDFTVPAIKGRSISQGPLAGLYPSYPAVIDSVTNGSPAQKAGLRRRDTVVSINGRAVGSWFQVQNAIVHYDSSVGPLRFEVRRAGSLQSAEVSPEFRKDLGRYLMGAAPMAPAVEKKRYPPAQAVSRTLTKSWEYTIMIYDMVAKIVSKQVSPQQLAGPIGIVQMSGFVAMGGLSAILDFMALIGINLAVLNLLPLVITDGGLLLFLLIEAVRRKPLAVRHQMIVNRVAIAFFIALFVYVTFNDIARIPELFRLAK
jgi:regulator of sigma E protease